MKNLWIGLIALLAAALGALWFFFGRTKKIGAGNSRLTPTGVPGTSRGERNNNPCNLTPLSNGEKWLGQVGIDTGGDQGYLIFDTPINGIRAAGDTSLNYYLNEGRTTLADFSAWGPGDSQYGEDLASTLGVPSSVNFDVPNNLENLIKAISINENGEVPYTEGDWAEGTRLALAIKGL